MLTIRHRLLLLTPLALVLLPFLIGPAAFGFVTSFTNYGPSQRPVRWVGLANYAAVLGSRQFQTAAVNIVLFTVVTVAAELAVGFSVAYQLRDAFRGRGAVQVALLLPWLVSPIANGVMWKFLLNSRHGLVAFGLAWLTGSAPSSPLGLTGLALPMLMAVDTWHKAPLAAFLLAPGLLAIPPERWEQARLDGAPFFKRLRHVIWPELQPLLLTVALLLVGDSLGTFDTVLVLTGGGPGSQTVTPGLLSYQQAFQVNNWAAGTASAWLIVAAVLFTGLVYLRWLRARDE